MLINILLVRKIMCSDLFHWKPLNVAGEIDLNSHDFSYFNNFSQVKRQGKMSISMRKCTEVYDQYFDYIILKPIFVEKLVKKKKY